MFKKIALLAALCIASTQASAASIVNGSFEDGINISPDPFVTLGAGSTGITGWTISGGTIDYIGSYWNASDGQRSIDLNGNGPGATLSQQITGLVIGKTYKLSFDLSGNTDGGPSLKVSSNGVTENTQVFFSSSSSPIPNLVWTSHSLYFSAAGTTTNLIFSSQVDGPYGPALDNVSIEAVPVPAAGLLLLAGVGALAGFRRKRS